MTKIKPVVPASLYHYTCTDHGEPGITRNGKLLPHQQFLLGRHLVWLTDLPTPDAWALGLTNYLLCCDRTQIRVTVHPHAVADHHGIRPWWFYRRGVDPVLRDALEQSGMPMHWWVTDQPVPIVDITPTAQLWAQRKTRAHA